MEDRPGRRPWMREHVELYHRDPEKAHWFVTPAGGDAKPCLLLATTGRKSGERREIVLIYGEAPTGFVVIASSGGAPDHPGWYRNLQDDPTAEIMVGAARHTVRARDAKGPEREALWSEMLKILPQFDDYKKATEGLRAIPVVVLEPV